MPKPTKPVRDLKHDKNAEAEPPVEYVPGMTPDPDEVATLLERSRALHRSAMPQGHRRCRPVDWKDTLKAAKGLREQAFALDPNRETKGWVEEQNLTPSGFDSHVVLMAFYDSL